jgi:hypothetical protein
MRLIEAQQLPTFQPCPDSLSHKRDSWHPWSASRRLLC